MNKLLRCLYVFWQWTWGFPQTFIGALIFLCSRGPRIALDGAQGRAWPHMGSLSMGMFVFVSGNLLRNETAFGFMLRHEYGHTLQSLLLGPLYLPFIGLPSLFWCHLPACRRSRERTGRSYYSFYTERWANRLARTGEK